MLQPSRACDENRFAGVAQLVERQPSKLNVEGSSPFARFAARGFLEPRVVVFVRGSSGGVRPSDPCASASGASVPVRTEVRTNALLLSALRVS